MMEEKELIDRVIAGDPEAEESFYKAYQPRLFRASMYFLGGRDSEAEDIVHDTFMVALPKLKDYVFRAPIYAWLRQICLRLCYARLRNRRRTLASLEEDLETFMRRMAVERIQSEDLESQKQQKLDLLTRLKKKLNPDSGRILDLRSVQGMSYIQISQALKIPMGTVMSRLTRARDQLRKLVEEQQANVESVSLEKPLARI